VGHSKNECKTDKSTRLCEVHGVNGCNLKRGHRPPYCGGCEDTRDSDNNCKHELPCVFCDGPHPEFECPISAQFRERTNLEEGKSCDVALDLEPAGELGKEETDEYQQHQCCFCGFPHRYSKCSYFKDLFEADHSIIEP